MQNPCHMGVSTAERTKNGYTISAVLIAPEGGGSKFFFTPFLNVLDFSISSLSPLLTCVPGPRGVLRYREDVCRKLCSKKRCHSARVCQQIFSDNFQRFHGFLCLLDLLFLFCAIHLANSFLKPSNSSRHIGACKVLLIHREQGLPKMSRILALRHFPRLAKIEHNMPTIVVDIPSTAQKRKKRSWDENRPHLCVA